MTTTLHYGDCLEIMPSIPDKSIDMILCDLPFGVTKCKWDVIIPFEPLWTEYERIIKDNGAIILHGVQPFTSALIYSNKELFRYCLIWEKTTPTGFLNAKKMPLRVHEDIIVFYKKLPAYNPQKTFNHPRKVSTAKHKANSKKTDNYNDHQFVTYDSTERYPVSIVKFPNDKQKESLHPTQKPVALLEYLIKTYTNENETVLDNCMGSGSTGIASINTNRNFIGIEMDEKYFKIAEERINKVIAK